MSEDTAGTKRGQNGDTIPAPDLRSKAIELRAAGRSIRGIAEDLGKSKSTIERWLSQPSTQAEVAAITTEVEAKVHAAVVDRLAEARAESIGRLVELLPDADKALAEVVRDGEADPHARLRGVAMIHDRVLGKIPSPDKPAPGATVNVNVGDPKAIAALLDTTDPDTVRRAAYGSPREEPE